MDHRHFHQLFADFHRRVQGRHWFLIDHCDFIATHIAQFIRAHLSQVATLEFNRSANNAAIYAQILHHPEGNSGFTASRFANQSNGFAWLNRDREIHNRRNFAQACKEGNRQVVNFENWTFVIRNLIHVLLPLWGSSLVIYPIGAGAGCPAPTVINL